MKLFEKIKDLFTDEIGEDNDELLEIKEDDRKSSILKKEKKDEKENETMEQKEEIEIKKITEKELLNNFINLETDKHDTTNNSSNNNFRFPISFEEEDLLDENLLGNQNIMQREKKQEPIIPEKKELYYSNKKEEKISGFRVSPVISPVYGILDKNYKKEEVQPKPVKSKDITRNRVIDFESVRKKAYGSLVDDIKENLSPIKKEQDEPKKFEDFYNLNEDISEITIGDVENNFEDFGVTIDSYKKDKKEEIEIFSFSDKEPVVEKIEINESVINSKKQEDDYEEQKEDIFNLIDNMYQEKEEENND